jgi:hypothetical protein
MQFYVFSHNLQVLNYNYSNNLHNTATNTEYNDSYRIQQQMSVIEYSYRYKTQLQITILNSDLKLQVIQITNHSTSLLFVVL